MMEMYPESEYRDEDLPPYECTNNETQQKIQAQKEYCEKAKMPYFALDNCTNCRRNYWERITLKEASTQLITGCKICGNSFCE